MFVVFDFFALPCGKPLGMDYFVRSFRIKEKAAEATFSFMDPKRITVLCTVNLLRK